MDKIPPSLDTHKQKEVFIEQRKSPKSTNRHSERVKYATLRVNNAE